MSESPETPQRRKLAPHTKIFIGLIVGAVAGVVVNQLAAAGTIDAAGLKWFLDNPVRFVGQLFLRLIFMVVVPLLFSALTIGVAELGDVRRLGRIGAKTFGFTLIVTTVSVVLGIALVNTIQPGNYLSEEKKAELVATTGKESVLKNAESAKAVSTVDRLLAIVPRNPIGDAANATDPFPGYAGSGFLAVMFFAFIFGVALGLVDEEQRGPVLAVLQGIYAAVMKIIGFAMALAPFAVAALVFNATATLGLEVFATLGMYIFVVLLGLSIHQFVVYSLLLRFLARVNPITFFKRITSVMLTAFSTSSSNATLPTAIQVTEEELGVPRQITRFVLTLGSTANQNGTALYEGITVLFLAQVFNVHLDLTQQLTVVLMSILAGIGTAGVPGGSLPLVVLVLQTVGVPADGIAIILGVDRILDMSRTVLNVTGDITAATYVARSEGYDVNA